MVELTFEKRPWGVEDRGGSCFPQILNFTNNITISITNCMVIEKPNFSCFLQIHNFTNNLYYKTLPQAKRHRPSLLFTILTFITRSLDKCYHR